MAVLKKHFSTLAMLGFLASCSDNSPVVSQKSQDANNPISASDLDVICRALVATTMGRPIDIIKIDKNDGNITYVSYLRPSDGKEWKLRCKVLGSRVIWSTVDIDGPNTGFGRWRNHPADSVITYSLTPDSVTINEKYSDGSGNTKTFPREPK